MSSEEDSFDWAKPIPETEVDLDELEHDDYGLRQHGEPFTGIAVSHHPNGQIESRRPYLNGVPHGLCRWWHSNGQLRDEWTAYRGMGHGWSTEWRQDGSVKKVGYAEFGCPLEWSEFDEAGQKISSGSNRENKNTLLWIERGRKELPDAP